MTTPEGKPPAKPNRLLRIFLGVLPGIALGCFFYFVMDFGNAAFVVGGIACLIGAALAQPEVSTMNVL